MSLPNAASTAGAESQDLTPAAVVSNNRSSPPNGDIAAAQGLDQLAQHLTNGRHAGSAPETGHATAASATAAAPVPNLPPAGQRPGRLDRTGPRQPLVRTTPVRSTAMEEQFRAISAKLPQLLEQALQELETRSKIEFDRKWAVSVTAFEQRLTEMNQRLSDGLAATPGAAVTTGDTERLRKENQAQRRRLGFYRAAFWVLCAAFVLGAVLFLSLIFPL